MEFQMLSDAVIILANMRGGYTNVGSTVHTLFRMSGRRRPSEPNKELGENVKCGGADLCRAGSRNRCVD